MSFHSTAGYVSSDGKKNNNAPPPPHPKKKQKHTHTHIRNKRNKIRRNFAWVICFCKDLNCTYCGGGGKFFLTCIIHDFKLPVFCFFRIFPKSGNPKKSECTFIFADVSFQGIRHVSLPRVLTTLFGEKVSY